jgi:hypothetical protein
MDGFSLKAFHRAIASHCRDCGIYFPDYYDMRVDGGTMGFRIGDTDNDDLPERFRFNVEAWDAELYKLFSSPNIFAKPLQDQVREILTQTYGHGYDFMRSLVKRTHPNYQVQASLLIVEFPKQKENENLSRYFLRFQGYLEQKAWIMDQVSDISAPSTLDIFINNARYPEYLNRHTIDDRRNLQQFSIFYSLLNF